LKKGPRRIFERKEGGKKTPSIGQKGGPSLPGKVLAALMLISKTREVTHAADGLYARRVGEKDGAPSSAGKGERYSGCAMGLERVVMGGGEKKRLVIFELT